jgi:hypothetical protein
MCRPNESAVRRPWTPHSSGAVAAGDGGTRPGDSLPAVETIRQYGEQRLTERDELERWRAHHADYYASLLPRMREHAHDPRAEVFCAGERARVLRAPAGPPNHSRDRRTVAHGELELFVAVELPGLVGGAGAKTSSVLGQLAKKLPTKEIAPAGCIRGAASRSAYGRLLALLWSVEVVGAGRCHCEGVAGGGAIALAVE